MPTVQSYAALKPRSPLVPFSIERREPRPDDVVIDVLYCGICHTDIHQVADDWGAGIFPMVPGHEIVGRVVQVGVEVTKFKIGDAVGVGCMVDSCRHCRPCTTDLEQFCEKGMAPTYAGTEMDRRTPTYGGYSARMVITQHFVLKIPDNLDLAGAAPLLCAGITTYSPLRQLKCGRGDRVAVVGLGGLGHMAVKLAASMGAEVTLLSTSPGKEADARRLGAQGFELTTQDKVFERMQGRFDYIIDTLSVPHDFDAYVGTLRPQGTLVVLGVPAQPIPIHAVHLVIAGRRLMGSLIGGVAETQEMLDYCGTHRIVSDVEIIPIQKADEAYRRILKSDVRYRFVIDMASLNTGAMS